MVFVLGGEGHSWSGQVIMCPVRVDVWRKEDWGSWLNSTGNEQVRSWGAGMLEIPKVSSQVEAGSCAEKWLPPCVCGCNALKPQVMDVSLASLQAVRQPSLLLMQGVFAVHAILLIEV